MSGKPKKKIYVDVNVPRELEPYLKEALENPEIQKELEIGRFRKTYSGLGTWIIQRFLVERTSFHFQHFKTYNGRAAIVDNKLRRLINIYPKLIAGELGFWCEYCDSTDCEHVEFARTVPEIMRLLKSK